jgi:hypothetical protein
MTNIFAVLGQKFVYRFLKCKFIGILKTKENFKLGIAQIHLLQARTVLE